MADQDEEYILDNEYKVKNFIKDMPSAVSFRRPRSKDHLWAFWCEPTLSSCSGCITDSVTNTPTSNQGITEKIKFALLHFKNSLDVNSMDHILIQFWAPITTETGSLQLVTSDQPFGLSVNLDERLLNYRKHCLQYRFNVDGEQHIGIPGLVFQQKRYACTQNVQYYSSKEYPQRNFALTCDISASFAFPVFQTSSQDCVGVLEIVTNKDYNTLVFVLKLSLRNALTGVDLKAFFCDCLMSSILKEGYRDTRDEIYKGLKVVCRTHNLPLAQAWVPCKNYCAVASDGSMGQTLHLQWSKSYVPDYNNNLLAKFPEFCRWNDLRMGQGVVGRAYLSHKPCFRRDITEFSLTEYPLMPGARHFGLTGCFAICLLNTFTEEVDYILEFFLHPEIAYAEDPSNFLCSLLKTMKKHFRSFKLASGEELGISSTMVEMPDSPINLNSDDLDDEEDQKEEYVLKNFMKDMPSEVSFRRSTSKKQLWAFWSGGITDSVTQTTNQQITEKIKSALLDFNTSNICGCVLIQFWTPIITETGCFLVTSDQPFGLNQLDEQLLEYRKHCLEYKFNVDGLEHLGIPGLVFQRKWFEYTPDVQYYSSKEYPQRNFALTCGISVLYAIPVFHPSSEDCVGVLELVACDTYFKYLHNNCNWFLMNALKDVDLKSSLCDCLISSETLAIQIFTEGYQYTRDELCKGFKFVCKTHKLPFAQTWVNVVTSDGSMDNNSNKLDVSCMGQSLHLQRSQFYAGDDYNDLLEEFLGFCMRKDLQRGQGVVGRAYLSRKPCFCKDITQFSRTEYPLLPIARNFGLTSCFAICLQSTYTGIYDYILEFFLHPENTYGEDPNTFLCSLLETMKQHLPSFKLASGEKLGKELLIDDINNGRTVVNAERNNIRVSCSDEANMNPASFQCQSIRLSPGPGVLNNGQDTMLPHSSNQQLIVDDINNGHSSNQQLSYSDESHMNQDPASLQCQSTRSPFGPQVLHNGKETMQPHSSNQQPIVKGRNIVNAVRNNTAVCCSEEANSITYVELKKHFGKKIEDVAQIFGVSRSTIKRKCRENGISRWPRSKRNNMNDSPSRQDPSCSDLAADKPVASLVTPPPEARKITIKATYGDDMIKFQLPFSSRMVELEEEVSQSLKLYVGTFKIKYVDDDGDRILIARDKDLQACMSDSKSLGMKTIKMFIEPNTKISPST